MKDFYKFLESEDKKSKKKDKVAEVPSEETTETEEEQEMEKVTGKEEKGEKPFFLKNKKNEEVQKKLTYNESLVYDDEFKKWIAMSDKIQGFSDEIENITKIAEKSADLTEYAPVPGAAVPQQTVAQSGQPPFDFAAALKVFKTNPAIAAGLAANPALKPLSDFLQKNA
jgi:hypothetical protein